MKQQFKVGLILTTRLEECFNTFPSFLQKGMKIKVLTVDAPFIDIGTPEGIRGAEAFIKKHRVKFTQRE